MFIDCIEGEGRRMGGKWLVQEPHYYIYEYGTYLVGQSFKTGEYEVRDNCYEWRVVV